MHRIKKISAQIVQIPLKRPHVMSLMTVKHVDFLLVKITEEQGLEGWGEAAFLGGPTWSEESVESAAAVVQKYLAPYLIGQEGTQLESLRMRMEQLVRGNHFAKAAVEMALFDLTGKAFHLPVYELLGGKVRSSIPMSWSLATGDIKKEIQEAEEKYAQGFRIFKFKTGVLSLEQDIARVAAIREHFDKDLHLRIDANQGWSFFEALEALQKMAPYHLDFAEQPLPKDDREGLSILTQKTPVPLLADESLDSLQNAMDLIRAHTFHLFGIKLTKIGGLLGGERLASLAEAAHMDCYVGCMIETGLGTAAYLHFAASTPQVTLGCELFGPLLLADTITTKEPNYQDGSIFLSETESGFGVEIDASQLKRYTVADPIIIQ